MRDVCGGNKAHSEKNLSGAHVSTKDANTRANDLEFLHQRWRTTCQCGLNMSKPHQIPTLEQSENTTNIEGRN